ncbi:hypothetical protein TRIP_C60155 [Candidatus Zixiibacteriota bacterium]|nr:hypothetical protein TRIP_C60155 [candidate division Zixibacteria bacterium]
MKSVSLTFLITGSSFGAGFSSGLTSGSVALGCSGGGGGTVLRHPANNTNIDKTINKLSLFILSSLKLYLTFLYPVRLSNNLKKIFIMVNKKLAYFLSA